MMRLFWYMGPSPAAHPFGQPSQLFLLKEPVTVCINESKAVFHPLGNFFRGESAVTVPVHFQKSIEKVPAHSQAAPGSSPITVSLQGLDQ